VLYLAVKAFTTSLKHPETLQYWLMTYLLVSQDFHNKCQLPS